MAQDLAEYDPITGEPLVSEQCPNDEDKPDAVADEYMSTRNFTRAAEEDVPDHALPAVFKTGRTLEQREAAVRGREILAAFTMLRRVQRCSHIAVARQLVCEWRAQMRSEQPAVYECAQSFSLLGILLEGP